MQDIPPGDISPVEPHVNDIYINNPDSFFSKVSQLLVSKNKKWIVIDTPALDATRYKLFAWFEKSDAKVVYQFRVRNPDKTMINGADVGYTLGFNPKTGVVSGAIFNKSHQPDNMEKITQNPIRNLSGVMAPIEDALCQVLSNVHQITVIRDFSTNQPRLSRYVTNYLRRGYVDRNIDGPTQGHTNLIKVFNPNP